MQQRWLCLVPVIATLSLLNFSAPAQTPTPPANAKSTIKTIQARGPFDVKINPLPPDKELDSQLGRLLLDKQLHGDLEGTSKGVMLTADTSVKNSGSYVAFEKFTGTLHGRKGSFILQHGGTLDRGAQHLSITVVPDSGTDQLAGLTGSMNIVIQPDGKHFYEFDYAIDPR